MSIPTTGTLGLGSLLDRLPTNFNATAVSSSQVLTDQDVGKSYAVTTGASVISFTLPAASSTVGKSIQVSKADSGSGRVEINSTLAHLYAQGDVVVIQSNGTSWNPISVRIAPLSQIFVASGTYTVPPLASRLLIEAYGGGGGGGRGFAGAGGTARTGGCGGGGGGYSQATVITQGLPTTSFAVTIAGGGNGSPAGTGSGGSGSAGGNTSIGDLSLPLLRAFGGRGGSGGSDLGATSGGLGAATYSTDGASQLGLGASPATIAVQAGAGGGGGGGGGITAGSALAGGSAGGFGGRLRGPGTPGAIAGLGDGGAGQAPVAAVPTALNFVANGGGGGGAASLLTTSGVGGAGGFPAGGGGGSGAATAANTAAAGGRGGDGVLLVVAMF